MTIDTRVEPTATHVLIRVEIHHVLRAAEAGNMLSCLSDIAALIAGSDYVELAEADPADAERWKSLALVVKESTIGEYWDLVVQLPGCTPEQVQEVARKYLVDERLTVAYLDPQPISERKPVAPPAGLRHGQ